MKTTLVRLAAWVLLSISSAIVGGVVTAKLYINRGGAATESVLRARRFELVDDNGVVRGVMGIEDNGDVDLRMLSSDLTPMIFLGVLAQTKERQELVKESGAVGEYYPAPFLEMTNRKGYESVELTTAAHGYGLLRFTDAKSLAKIRLGYSGTDDVTDSSHENGVWGLLVQGRTANGLGKYTGLGMESHDGIDGEYIVPHPAGVSP